MLSKLLKNIFPPKDVIGIDIGNYAVKIIWLSEVKKVLTGKDPGSEGACSGPAYESSSEHADI